ncbi:hypothetical protein CDL15_Pgr020708 [Punica granatum]|uniref:Uncharacterized protein n=1 Tax=Punica granatum TaxID=22663 RepID=A0A218VU56_PUNGR|nr:hypothetical protein CDL15_Pgr020708 [Punica granatum]PKI51039.1 hypothetical protein CRG98_028564 [Punica granatum]
MEKHERQLSSKSSRKGSSSYSELWTMVKERSSSFNSSNRAKQATPGSSEEGLDSTVEVGGRGGGQHSSMNKKKQQQL